jgi:RNA polymerase sigma factor (sigma-70 family)
MMKMNPIVVNTRPPLSALGVSELDGCLVGERSQRRGMTVAREPSHSAQIQTRQVRSGSYTAAVSASPFLDQPMTAEIPTTSNLEPHVERAAAAYRANYDLLWFLVTRRFRIAPDDAREVIHDVFVAFIRNEKKITASAADERSWLVGATCNSCRYYWRTRKSINLRQEELPEELLHTRVDPIVVADSVIARVLLARVLRDLPERCRDVLRRRYSEGHTSEEIAEWQAVKRGSAKNLISKCLMVARVAFKQLTRRKI